MSARISSLEAGLTVRSLSAALVLTYLAGLWVRQAEIVILATQVSESVPAIPGVAALGLMLLVNALLRRIPGARPFTRAEILVVFLFVTIASTITGIGVMQFLIALITVPFYINTDHIPANRPFLPGWLAPHNTLAIRRMYEHAPNGQVPWGVWLAPIVCWTGFFLALWWTLYCIMALFFRAWAEEERLSFPLVALPMEMTGGQQTGAGFWRNGYMWSGFAVSAVYNGVNIVHAFWPSMPAPGKWIDMSPMFTAQGLPWSEVAPILFHIRPELIGLGFLVSTEVSLTVWVSYVGLKLLAVFGAAHGSPPGLLPLEQEQGIGAFLMMACILAWLARRHLAAAFRVALQNRPQDGPEGIRYRWLFVGAIGGFLAVWAFMSAAGMAKWVAAAYLAVVIAVALVYGRLRAEAGVPLIWLFPFYMQKDIFFYALGSGPLEAASPSTVSVFTLFTFLARGFFPEMTGYQIEAIEIARRTRMNGARLALGLFLACAAGLVIGWINHLVPYYRWGAAQLRDGGVWGEWLARPAYTQAADYATTPAPPQLPRVYATVAGATVVMLLWMLRLRFAGFWFHPIGYAMTCSYGSLIWSSFLIVWILKSLTLRYGGMKMYRRWVPFFLGLALGHFAVAGIFWGLTGASFRDAALGYPVYFG